MKKLFLISFSLIIVALSLYVGYSLTVDKPGKEGANTGAKNKGAATETNKGKDVKKSDSKKPSGDKKDDTIKLYYQNGDYLRAETRTGIKATPQNAIKELLKGPTDSGNQYFIPKTTKLLSFKVVDGTATVNFSKEILDRTRGGATEEELTIYSITNTLTEFSSVNEVVIQIEGTSDGEVDGRPVQDFWGHVGFYDQPFKRDKALIKETTQ